MSNEVPSITQVENQKEKRSLKQRITALAVGALALAGSFVAYHYAEASPVPCDPVIDNGCVPSGPGSTLATLPEKGSTTSISTTTTQEVTTTTKHIAPPTTEHAPAAPPTMAPASPHAPKTD